MLSTRPNCWPRPGPSPGGWVYEIDPAYAPDGPDGAVPPEGIKGGWKIGDDGQPTGEYKRNDRYRPASP
jgi:hypothetical protein